MKQSLIMLGMISLCYAADNSQRPLSKHLQEVTIDEEIRLYRPDALVIDESGSEIRIQDVPLNTRIRYKQADRMGIVVNRKSSEIEYDCDITEAFRIDEQECPIYIAPRFPTQQKEQNDERSESAGLPGENDIANKMSTIIMASIRRELYQSFDSMRKSIREDISKMSRDEEKIQEELKLIRAGIEVTARRAGGAEQAARAAQETIASLGARIDTVESEIQEARRVQSSLRSEICETRRELEIEKKERGSDMLRGAGIAIGGIAATQGAILIAQNPRTRQAVINTAQGIIKITFEQRKTLFDLLKTIPGF